MRETIDHSLSRLSDADLHAISAYLKSVTGQEAYKPGQTPAAVAVGAGTYLSYCASCHRVDGGGVAGIIPSLAGNGAVKAQGPENVIRVILGGREATNGLAPMPAVGAGMTDQEVADVANYVRTAWGNDAPANAGAGLVGTLRARTQTLLAGNLQGGCPSIGDPNLAKVIDDTSVRDQLRIAPTAEMLDRIDAILPKVKASGASTDDIVNALTAAYCSIGLGGVSPSQRAAMLGSFSGLVYGQIRKGDKPN
jgi:mono/diheme cytochrome c family protein